MEKQKAFTLVEVIVVIAVLGILSTLVAVGYGNWRQGAMETAIKADLNNAVAAMENERNYGNGYPTSLPSSIKTSKNATLAYASGDAKDFCINGYSTSDPSIKFYVNQAGEVKSGDCGVAVLALNTNYVSAYDSNLSVNWPDSTGATGYEIQLRLNGGSWVTNTVASSNYMTTSVSPGQVYDIRILAVYGSTKSAWSNTISVTIPQPSITGLGVCSVSGAQTGDALFWTSGPSSKYPYFIIEDPNGGEVQLDNNKSTAGQFVQRISGVDGEYFVYSIDTNDYRRGYGVYVSAHGSYEDCY